METINSKVMKLAHANYKEALKDHAARVAKFEANKAQMTSEEQAREAARLEKKAPAFKGCLKHAWYVCKIDYESKRDKAAKAKAAKVAVTATMRAMATTSAYAAVKKAKNSNLSQTNTPSKRRPNLSYTKFWYLKPLPLPIWHTKWPLKASKWLKP